MSMRKFKLKTVVVELGLDLWIGVESLIWFWDLMGIWFRVCIM